MELKKIKDKEQHRCSLILNSLRSSYLNIIDILLNKIIVLYSFESLEKICLLFINGEGFIRYITLYNFILSLTSKLVGRS